MKCGSTISGFVSGSASAYDNFWEAWARDLITYSPSECEEITNYLTQQVFGTDLTGDEDFEDSEMQAAFNMAMQQKISGGL